MIADLESQGREVDF